MNPQLQTLLDFFQQNKTLTAEEKIMLEKTINKAKSDFEISEFKLERTEKVKRTTAILLEETIEELEQKRKAVEAQNKELEIEAALERVRTVAMSMRKSAEVITVCEAMYKELTVLGFTNIRNSQIAIKNDAKQSYTISAYSEDDVVVMREHPYKASPIVEELYNELGKSKDAFYKKEFSGKEFEGWRKWRESLSALKDEREKAATSLCFYLYSIGEGYLGISTYNPITEEQEEIIKRFKNVFELSYQRYTDVAKAEAQAREAQIQLALERVRARTMAMQKQNDLLGVLDLLVEQLVTLGVNLQVVNFSNGIPGGDWDLWIEVVAGSGTIFNNYVHFPRIDHPYFHHVEKNIETYRKDSTDLFKDVFSKEDKDSWQDYINTQTIIKDLQSEEINPSMYDKPGYTWSMIILKDTWVSIGRFNTIPFSDEEDALLRRFANAFGQAYTRFLDLQKAEAQAREAEIQLALERVRARTMAMQKSEELAEAAEEMFKQVNALGAPEWSCGFDIFDQDEKSVTQWISGGHGLLPPFKTPLTEHSFFKTQIEARHQKTDFLIMELGGQELKDLYDYIFQFPDAKKVFDQIKYTGLVRPEFQVMHFAFFSQGYLLFITYEPVPEMWNIFKRFAKVFEQTYTRFLDLQKAETQAREAQIEAALERVRSRSMAMHRGDELAETSTVLFEQISSLGIKPRSCGFLIMHEDSKMIDDWSSNADEHGNALQVSGTFTFNQHPLIAEVVAAWYRRDPYFIGELHGEELQKYYKAVTSSITSSKEIKEKVLDTATSEYTNSFYFEYGMLYVLTPTPLPEHERNVILRFTGVFKLTYRRFLDLQKAEEQAREAQIETALERVRSRSMGMQKSEELRDVVQIIFDQLIQLNFEISNAGFLMDYRESDDGNIWMTDATTEFPTKQHIPWFDHPFNKDYLEQRDKGPELFTKVYSYEEKNTWWEVVLKYLPRVSEETKKALLSLPALALSRVFMKNIGLYLLNSAGTPYSDQENATLIRFSKVFEQTYTRFNDLKRAEAQAREATKQASLDRVRGQIASMRSTEDLQRITPLIWHELTMLDVPFIRCGVIIIDETKGETHIYLSSPDGHSLAVMNLPIQSNTLTANSVAYWRKGLVYTEHWSKEDFVKWMQSMMKQGQVQNSETYQGAAKPPESLHLHFVPFTQGMLYVGNTVLLTNDEIDLVKSLAEAFSIAYARYEDFIKLEKAKQSIEITLTELKATQSQLIQSEKMASLGELTAGIAHEIQNPLNFVNNFSEVNTELLIEMKDEMSKGNMDDANAIADDVIENSEKINHHGKRAGDIVKGMLQHSRTSTGVKEPTDINALADEYLRLSYHGLRAKDKEFNATMKTDFDKYIGKINIIPQDIGRVLLNLYNNAFYACTERSRSVVNQQKNQNPNLYNPTVSVKTKKLDNHVIITVSDNGNGIPQNIVDKIFQPFFTTKPTGSGTGLGLSLSYDIIKAHGGEIKVETKEGDVRLDDPVGRGTTFIIQLPCNAQI